MYRFLWRQVLGDSIFPVTTCDNLFSQGARALAGNIASVLKPVFPIQIALNQFNGVVSMRLGSQMPDITTEIEELGKVVVNVLESAYIALVQQIFNKLLDVTAARVPQRWDRELASTEMESVKSKYLNNEMKTLTSMVKETCSGVEVLSSLKTEIDGLNVPNCRIMSEMARVEAKAPKLKP